MRGIEYWGIECTCLKVLEMRNIGFASIETVWPQLTKMQNNAQKLPACNISGYFVQRDRERDRER